MDGDGGQKEGRKQQIIMSPCQDATPSAQDGAVSCPQGVLLLFNTQLTTSPTPTHSRVHCSIWLMLCCHICRLLKACCQNGYFWYADHLLFINNTTTTPHLSIKHPERQLTNPGLRSLNRKQPPSLHLRDLRRRPLQRPDHRRPTPQQPPLLAHLWHLDVPLLDCPRVCGV